MTEDKLEEFEERLPPKLLAFLLAHQEILEASGSVTARIDAGRRPSFRLRFRAYDRDKDIRRRRSLALSDDEALVVEELLARWRAGKTADDEGGQPEGENEWETFTQAERQKFKTLAGGGWRQRARVGEAFDEAAKKGIRGLWEFLISSGYRLPPSKPGPVPHQKALQRLKRLAGEPPPTVPPSDPD